MWTKRINRASPEQVFITVRNNDATTASVGRGVAWDYQMAGTTSAANDGYSVRIPGRGTYWTGIAVSPSRVAGVVAGRDILPGIFGSVQVYGQHNAVAVTVFSNTTQGFHGATQLVPWNDTTVQSVVLRLPNAMPGGLTSSTAINDGLWAVCYAFTTAVTADVASLAALRLGGYCIPVDQIIPAGATTYGTINATTPTGTVKAFIHCME